jgi:hypothetical protein
MVGVTVPLDDEVEGKLLETVLEKEQESLIIAAKAAFGINVDGPLTHRNCILSLLF